MLAANKVGDVEGGNKSIEKYGKLSKGLKSSKSGYSKGKKSVKSKKPSKNGNSPIVGSKKAGPSFLTLKIRVVFDQLRLAFIKALILQHFDLECDIQIEIDISGYAIGGMLSKIAFGTRPNGVVTKTDLAQWHPVAFFSRKIIPAETQYKTYDGKHLAIVEIFKTWCQYLEVYKHEFLVLLDHNNIRRFMNTKSLSSRQVR